MKRWWVFILIALCVPILTLVKASKAHEPKESTSSLALYASFFPDSKTAPDLKVFQYAIEGAQQLKATGKMRTSKLALVDFSKLSTEKRLWVIDLDEKQVLFHSLVAHGKNSGENRARTFSNRPQSYMSSLGFYITGNTYQGKHGLSLYLDGQEKGINDKARERAIVMHGADYVSQGFIKRVGRLGRSHGCPAVPMEVHKEMIQTLANGACLFIWHPDANYANRSSFLEPDSI